MKILDAWNCDPMPLALGPKISAVAAPVRALLGPVMMAPYFRGEPEPREVFDPSLALPSDPPVLLGLADAEGWITRLEGGPRPVRCEVEWTSEDGTLMQANSWDIIWDGQHGLPPLTRYRLVSEA